MAYQIANDKLFNINDSLILESYKQRYSEEGIDTIWYGKQTSLKNNDHAKALSLIISNIEEIELKVKKDTINKKVKIESIGKLNKLIN